MIDVTDRTFVRLLAQSDICVLYFWAEWCVPCKAVSPMLERLEKHHPGVGWYRINAEANPRLAMHYDVQGLPTLLAFQRGELIDGLAGTADYPTIQAWVERILACTAS